MILIASLVLFQIPLEVNGIQLMPPPKALTTDTYEVETQKRMKRDDELMTNTSVISHEFPLTEENL